MQPAPQDNQLMSKHRALSLKPQLRLEWRGQDGLNETEQPDHSASLGDSITASTRIRFSVHTAVNRDIGFSGILSTSWKLCHLAESAKKELRMFGLKRPTRIDLRSNDAAIVVRENGEMEM